MTTTTPPTPDELAEQICDIIACDDGALADLDVEILEQSAATLTALATEVARLREALEEIANPLATMARRAKAEGARLSGMAAVIAQDPEHLKRIARTALETQKAPPRG